jgi:hypothetical protein
MTDTAAVIGAAAKFLRAWKAATQGDEPSSLSDPAVVEAHEAAQELIRATGTMDLVGAYVVVDDLVHRMN